MKRKAVKVAYGVSALIWGGLAGSYFVIFWDGISKWWKITNLDFEEVQGTVFQEIWTSGRVVPAMVFAFVAVVSAYKFFVIMRGQNAEPGAVPETPSAASMRSATRT